ncbi:hypothetical protein [Paenibacillus sp. 481]|uniref:hypothetical protein n=1 Tax=Paenibacillus sp. 481 TaxID=2835869 RepID=UPI001E625B55|nr:hypothetical protein [Paenibacillus sp. 481]UHA72293.1 hypothetical protein KIK04_16605 [Paenibacillus sp. 481]
MESSNSINSFNSFDQPSYTAFTKRQWLQADRWTPQQRDILNALLPENEEQVYTEGELEALQQQFLNQEVV